MKKNTFFVLLQILIINFIQSQDFSTDNLKNTEIDRKNIIEFNYSQKPDSLLILKVDKQDNPEFVIPSLNDIGDSLPRIQFPGNYKAFVHAINLSGPDGLAFSPEGKLYVAQEYAGSVSEVAENGIITTYASGFSSPEGIAFDTNGNLYVAEDIQNGKVFFVDIYGNSTIIANDRDAPEGVAVNANGEIFITESNVQFVSNPFEYSTHLTQVYLSGEPEYIQASIWFWSYSGITIHNSGIVYVCNEASGTGTDNSVFTIDTETGVRSLFCSGLTACEGLRFQPGGIFPLIVVEEDLGNGQGRLSFVDSLGNTSIFATGFYNIEDVVVDEAGRIFVTEDGSGMIIRIENIITGPIADFIADTISGDAPLEVGFTDLSISGTSTIIEWEWDFGDGNSSTLQNPVNIYEFAGTYTVSLTITDEYNLTSTKIKENYISVTSSIMVQQIQMNSGYSFVSSRIIPTNPDMMEVLEINLENIDFVRSTSGQMLRKIGPVWVNGIGDWISVEAYLFKINENDLLQIEGIEIDPQTNIELSEGYQLVSYLPDHSIDALTAFSNILDNLDFVRNTEGFMLRKIGPNWVNSIGNLIPGEGYLIKMDAAEVLIYPVSSAKFRVD
ncbi:MAG: PKD domain-containing protein [Bacteroidales bacterium]|nr:PKD domain-containing protein [Bacteroidales bacterium]